jgi:hypothetical protein
MKRLRVFLPLLFVCIFATVALAQSGAGYDLSWSTVVDSGGGNSSGGGYSLDGIIGQPAVGGPPLRGQDHTIRGGVLAPPDPRAIPNIYLPLVIK